MYYVVLVKIILRTDMRMFVRSLSKDKSVILFKLISYCRINQYNKILATRFKL